MNPSDGSWESTLSLLTRARGGDEEALEELFARYVPVMRRWAAGRLPQGLRDLTDTPDLVQDTMLQVLKRSRGSSIVARGRFTRWGPFIAPVYSTGTSRRRTRCATRTGGCC
jgi:RNA polymerase sigma-70 factor (ECF subfamily)